MIFHSSTLPRRFFCLTRQKERRLVILNERLITKLGEKSTQAKLTLRLGYYYMLASNLAESDAQYTQTVSLSKEIGDDAIMALAYAQLGVNAYSHAQYTDGIGFIHKAHDIGMPAEMQWVYYFIGTMQARLGRFSESVATMQRHLTAAQESGNLYVQAWGHNWSGMVRSLQGNWPVASEYFRKAIRLYEEVEDQFGGGVARTLLGYADFVADYTAFRAHDYMHELTRWEQTGSMVILCTGYTWIGERFALEKDTRGALTVAQKAIDLSETGGERAGIAVAFRVRALCGVQSNPVNWDAVDEDVHTSLRLAEAAQELPELAVTRFRSSEILHHKGDPEAARQPLAQATALFRDMRMDWWTEQAKALRGRLDRAEDFVWFAPYIDGPPTVV